MANATYHTTFYDNAVRAEVSRAIVNSKANVCPFTVRLAWHASGTFDKDDTSNKAGGSDGATMRFEPEITDGANAGLAIVQDLLKPVKAKFPNLSYADIWTLAGTQAIKLCGGPEIPFQYGRTDQSDDTNCPPNGRLPDASQGADHLRTVFYRMGFNDKDIVALSGAHTLGSCHERRSGFDGPWTSNPLKFDNEYFVNLINLKWTPRQWNGPKQYTDPSGKLMMLPTDMALIEDPKFRLHVETYAKDEALFFKDFATVFGKLLSLGCPAHCHPSRDVKNIHNDDDESAEDRDFRDLAMHGSLERMKALWNDNTVNNKSIIHVNSQEKDSLRTPMHKACFFGHGHIVSYLITECKADVNVVDCDGDTPLHDAARLGHELCVRALLESGAVKKDMKNNEGKTPSDLAMANGKQDIVNLLH